MIQNTFPSNSYQRLCDHVRQNHSLLPNPCSTSSSSSSRSMRLLMGGIISVFCYCRHHLVTVDAYSIRSLPFGRLGTTFGFGRSHRQVTSAPDLEPKGHCHHQRKKQQQQQQLSQCRHQSYYYFSRAFLFYKSISEAEENKDSQVRDLDQSTIDSSTNNNTIHHLDCEDWMTDDSALLRIVTKSQLVDLCQQCQLPSTGTKIVLLQRLRDFASHQATLEQERYLQRSHRVEEGGDDTKERYEIVNDGDSFGASFGFDTNHQANNDNDDDNDDDQGYFYFQSPDSMHSPDSTQKYPVNTTLGADTSVPGFKSKSHPARISNAMLTAPPPPLEPTNEQGERAVTIYSTMDTNDLTGIAAAQPGQTASRVDDLTTSGNGVIGDSSSGVGGSSDHRPWDLQHQTKQSTTSAQTQQAMMQVTELVETLLSMTGLPAFASMMDPDEDDAPGGGSVFVSRSKSVGFNPAEVPTDLLTQSSQALRTGRGQVLYDVLRQFELQAIGQDGIHGDNIDSGGGHYIEVSKVRAFLEGYRRAEVRRLARETTALLLDKLILEGVDGLDLSLASMTRSNDDTSSYAGELNDSLLEYLNDAIRQQEQKVQQVLASRLAQPAVEFTKSEQQQSHQQLLDDVDRLEALWNVTIEDGQRVESLDPNDPHVKQVLEEEYARIERQGEELGLHLNGDSTSLDPSSLTTRSNQPLPATAPEQLLLLLKLLRERLKVEAAFSPDEKGRNLRLLAYCLRLNSQDDCKQLITKEIGSSLDRMDSFIELVNSSIEYGESTSYQLQPGKKETLNLPQLKRILQLAEHIQSQQTRKASGSR